MKRGIEMRILKWVEAGRLETLQWARQVANWREGVQQTQSFLESPKSGQEKKHYKDIISMSMRLLEETI